MQKHALKPGAKEGKKEPKKEASAARPAPAEGTRKDAAQKRQQREERLVRAWVSVFLIRLQV